MALIEPVASQPTLLTKLQAIWDFTTVRLWALAGSLALIGFGIPTIQATFPDWHVLDWVPLWFLHICQACAGASFLGILPARVTIQPNLPAKQAARSASVPTPNQGG